jgi:hypothetical protein
VSSSWTLLAALALSGAAPVGPVSHQALFDAFSMACLTQGAPLNGVDTAALAAGFRPVPLLPAQGEVHETGAWEKDGIRIFTLSPQSDPRWRLPAACAARADLGQLEDEQALLDRWMEHGAVFGDRQGGLHGSHWTLPWRDGHLVQVFIDRTDPAHVSLMFYATAAAHRS